jgi:hypothetical protein
LRAGAVFFADPFRAVGAATRFAGLAVGRLFSAVERRFSAFGFSAFAGAAVLAAILCLGAAATVTFSTVLGGETLGAFITTLPTEAAGAGAGTGAGGAAFAAFVLPFGRPPFLANCASANILRKASCASAIS